MDFELSDDMTALRDMARRFAADEIGPHARQWDSEGEIPREVVKKLGELGFLGVLVPADLGGAELGYLGNAIVMEEIARQCGGTALMLAAHNGLCLGHILVAANEEQKKKYVPPLASGEMLGAWCLTEPSCGSDAAALKTRAVLDGDQWVINGSKMFITNGHRAGVFVVLARTSDESKSKGISAFFVERDTPGLIIGNRHDAMGVPFQNGPLSGEDVFVPLDVIIGGVDGAGKGAQLDLLHKALEDHNVEVVRTRDPGGTGIGDRVREVLLGYDLREMDVRCETLLFMASRAQLVAEVIEPALADGSAVLCDRFISSTYAYQGAAGYDVGGLLALANMAVGDVWPSLTVVLDVPVDQAFARMEGKHDAMEKRPRDFHERVRKNFLQLPSAYAAAVHVVDGRGDIDEVHDRILELIQRVDF